MHDSAIKNIKYLKSVTSSNDIAKKSSETEAVFVADEQTAGKGSKGRSWQSRKGDGLYMSFLVRPKIEMSLIPGITLMVAVVVCNAIEQVCGVAATIKWPNDVLVGGKKVAGILTESVFGAEGVERVVCGIGINTNQRFSGELQDKAASLKIRKKSQKMLLCNKVVSSFFDGYDAFLSKRLAYFMPEFRQRSAISGEVTIIEPNAQSTGALVGFDDTGAIIIDIGGEKRRFIAGEISLRGENGYV